MSERINLIKREQNCELFTSRFLTFQRRVETKLTQFHLSIKLFNHVPIKNTIICGIHIRTIRF